MVECDRRAPESGRVPGETGSRLGRVVGPSAAVFVFAGGAHGGVNDCHVLSVEDHVESLTGMFTVYGEAALTRRTTYIVDTCKSQATDTQAVLE